MDRQPYSHKHRVMSPARLLALIFAMTPPIVRGQEVGVFEQPRGIPGKQPEACALLGDNISADNPDMEVMRKNCAAPGALKDFLQLRDSTSLIATRAC